MTVDAMLAEIGAVSYRGEPMLDQLGKEIGVLWVVDDKPCQDLATERAFLGVAAKRAALEMLRLDSERGQHLPPVFPRHMCGGAGAKRCFGQSFDTRCTDVRRKACAASPFPVLADLIRAFARADSLADLRELVNVTKQGRRLYTHHGQVSRLPSTHYFAPSVVAPPYRDLPCCVVASN